MSPTLQFEHFSTVPWFQFINLFLVTLHCMLTTVCCINEVCIHILILKVSCVLISLVYSLYVCRFCIFWWRFYFVTVGWEFVYFFPHETECKPLVVCYSRLLLCLEQTLSFVWQSSMAWNMLHGLKTKERGKQPWDKTKNNSNKTTQSSIFSFKSQQIRSELVLPRHWQNQSSHKAHLLQFFWSFRFRWSSSALKDQL